MNRKLLLGIIIGLAILIAIIIVLLILGPKDATTNNPSNQATEAGLATDLQNLSSGDAAIDQNLNSEIVDLGK